MGVIPLRDASRRPSRVPVVTAWIIGINAVVFVLELVGGDAFVTQWSLVPAGGLAATAAQVGADPTSTVPNLGASGAIAAVMGAFIVTYPHDRIRSLLYIFVFFRMAYIPAVLLIGVWFLMQLVNLGSIVQHPQASGGVAYAAHVGGFIFGAVTARILERRPSPAAVGLFG